MPAIQPARLKAQIAELIEYFENPDEFIPILHTMLEFYADRTRRPGRAGMPEPLIEAYYVPRPVLNHIDRDLADLIAAFPEKALELSDTMWAESWLETRLLAIAILGKIDPIPLDRVSRRVEEWVEECSEGRLLNALLDKGITRLRLEQPTHFIQMVEGWLTKPQKTSQQAGLRAVISLLEDSNFDNLPVLFRLISPLVEDASSDLSPDLIDVLRVLARRSPQETAYFLRQTLSVSSTPEVLFLVRQILPSFQADVQAGLKAALREY